MKKAFVTLLLVYGAVVVAMASCQPYQPSAAAPVTAQPGILPMMQPLDSPTVLPVTPSVTAVPTENAALMAEVTLLFSRATDTQVAAAKTEAAYIDMQATSAAGFQTQIAIQTSIATMTQGAQTAVATVTNAAMTQAISNTGTALAMTKTIEQDKLNAARVGVWGITILAVLFTSVAGILAILWLGSKVWGSWANEQTRKLQSSKIEPDSQGRYPVVPASALPAKNDSFVNPNLSHRAVTHLDQDDLSTEQALMNTASHRTLEATRAIAQSPALARKLITPTKVTNNEVETDPKISIRKLAPGLLGDGVNITPHWHMFENWDGKGGIPYGMSERGLERVSIQQVPHGAVFGKTGSGKSRGFLRPFIAGAIASGQRVVIIGKEVDFWPFAQHPNVKMIGVRNVTEETEAGRYADYLKRIVEEMNRRDAILTSKRIATWDKAGFENTLIVLDELGNALDMMPTSIRHEAHRWVNGLVREGRKYGFNLWLASQRAVGFKSIVEQMGRAVFYLADAEASRYALGFPGAELLKEGQFIAKFHETQKCASFDPTDDELTQFLKDRNVKTHEPIDWIDGKVIDKRTVEERWNAQLAAEDIDAKILRLYAEMKASNRLSLSQIQREVYGDTNTGGAHFRHIQDLVSTANPATTPENMPPSSSLSSSATAATA
jgi:hypothetical protein